MYHLASLEFGRRHGGWSPSHSAPDLPVTCRRRNICFQKSVGYHGNVIPSLPFGNKLVAFLSGVQRQSWDGRSLHTSDVLCRSCMHHSVNFLGNLHRLGASRILKVLFLYAGPTKPMITTHSYRISFVLQACMIIYVDEQGRTPYLGPTPRTLSYLGGIHLYQFPIQVVEQSAHIISSAYNILNASEILHYAVDNPLRIEMEIEKFPWISVITIQYLNEKKNDMFQGTYY